MSLPKKIAAMAASIVSVVIVLGAPVSAQTAHAVRRDRVGNGAETGGAVEEVGGQARARQHDGRRQGGQDLDHSHDRAEIAASVSLSG